MQMCKTYSGVAHRTPGPVVRGAEALEMMFRSSIDDTSTIVREDLLEELKADVVSLPTVVEGQ